MSHTVAERVVLHPLAMAEEPDAWIVGRPDAGDFVALPAEAVTFLKALGDDPSVAGAEQQVHDAHGARIDAQDFVETLLALGFVASLDGEPQPDDAKPPSLPWLGTRQAAWAFGLPAQAIVLLVVVAGSVAATASDHLVPTFRAFFVTSLDGVNIALGTAMFLVVVAGHELCHLAGARSVGVHATIGLGTRLHMLAATTTVQGMWSAPRRARFRVYLAGMRFDLLVFSALALCQVPLAPGGVMYGLLESLRLAILISLITQFALYMRTDMYFVAQELLRCRNLYHDAWAHIRYVCASRSVRSSRPDPTRLLPEHEQRRVRVYAWFMLLGSFATLASFAFFGGPILVHLVLNALHSITGGTVVGVIDGALVLLVEGGLQALFLVVFWRKHAAKVRRFASRSGAWVLGKGGPVAPGRGDPV